MINDLSVFGEDDQAKIAAVQKELGNNKKLVGALLLSGSGIATLKIKSKKKS